MFVRDFLQKILDFNGLLWYYFKARHCCGVKKHALMREVADLESGNFRGVCPILNRAKELWKAFKILANFECRGDASRCSGIVCDPSNCRFYIAPKRNTRCGVSFARQPILGGENSHGSERKNPNSY